MKRGMKKWLISGTASPRNAFSPRTLSPSSRLKRAASANTSWTKETGLLVLDRVLYTSTHYPANYGFIPRTYADDGDPLDVLVLCSEAIDPLVMVRCYPIGVISMVDDNMNDEKIIAIPFGDPTYSSYRDISELPPISLTKCATFSRYTKPWRAGRRRSTRPWAAPRPCRRWRAPSGSTTKCGRERGPRRSWTRIKNNA